MRVVTIDGPAGAGKSSVAKAVAERLGWRFLDTGAMYRAATLAAIRRGIGTADRHAVARLADKLRVELPPGRVLLDGEDVSTAIRTREVTAATDPVAKNPEVRRVLSCWQRAFAAGQDTVTEGRDQGTIVFPDAICKVFLTASLQVRAQRRQLELAARGETVPIEDLIREIHQRDEEDRLREIAPLVPAPDAIELDATGMSRETVVEQVLQAIRVAFGEPAR